MDHRGEGRIREGGRSDKVQGGGGAQQVGTLVDGPMASTNVAHPTRHGKRTMSDKSNASGGIGFGGLLALLFIGLKLTGYINWSWWWVLAPIWIPLAIVLAIGVVAGVIAVVAAVAGSLRPRNRFRR